MSACIVWYTVFACSYGECVLHLDTVDAHEAMTLAVKLEEAPGQAQIVVSKWEECPDD